MKNLSSVLTLSLVSTSILLATVATALAQPSEASTHRAIPAVSNALELTIGTAYAQGSGDLGGDLPAVDDVAGSGGGLEASIGWRITPNLMIGAYATLLGFDDSTDSRNGAVTVATGIKADWHFLPAGAFDPWVSLGTGLKFLGIEDGDEDRALTGLELAKLQVGVDYRVSPGFAIGPVIGASAAMFNNQYEDVKSDDAMEIDDKQVNWTVTAGLMGRFDAFGTTH